MPSRKARSLARRASTRARVVVSIKGMTEMSAAMAGAAERSRVSFDEFTRAMQAASSAFRMTGSWSPYAGGGAMPWPRPVDLLGRPVEDARVTTLAGRPIEPDACICGDLMSRRGAWLPNCPRASQHEAARDRWATDRYLAEPDVQERVEKVQGVRRDNVRAIRVRDDHGR